MGRKEFSSERKERVKKTRVVMELVILAVLVILFLVMLFHFKRYRAWNSGLMKMSDKGVFALQIPGVGRLQTEDSFDEDGLEALLKELKHQGYVSVTQEEYNAYWKEGEQLPEKSVFLIFQDGKRDTAELAQPLLEKYNFKATMLLPEEEDQKEQYLSKRDCRTLVRSTYWEIGMDDEMLEDLDPIQTDPCWSVNHLLLEWGVSSDELTSAVLPKEMTLRSGYVTLYENSLKLTTNEKGNGKITLLPDEQFQDYHIMAEFCGDRSGTQQIGMRITKKSGIYIRLTDGKIQLLQKKNGDTEILDARDLSGINKSKASGYAADIRLSGTGITVYVNNRIIFNNESVSVTDPGKATISCSSKVNDEKGEDRIYDMELRDLTVSVDGKEIYDGSMKWYQSLFHLMKETRRNFTAWVQQTGQ